MERHDYVGKEEHCKECDQYPGHEIHQPIPGPTVQDSGGDTPPDQSSGN